MRAQGSVLAAILLVTGCSDPAPPPRVPHLELSATATAGLVLDKDTSQLAIRIRVAAGSLAAEARQPLDLVLVLDTSGSMVGAPIEATRAAAIRLVDRLSPGDRFAVVAFDSTARVVVASTAVTDTSRARARKAIGALVARGTTDLTAGLQLGLQQLALGHRAGSIDRIVLSGDGVPNDAAPVAMLIEQTRQARATITSLGLGVDYDEDLLARLAIDTGGGFHYLAEAAAASGVFDDELVRMQQVVGRNVRVTVRTGPGVTAEPMPGVEDLGATKVAWLGDLAAGESRDVIIPIAVAGRRAGATIELVDVEVEYDDLVGGPPHHETLRGFVSAAASADPAAVAASVKLPLEAARRRAIAASTILEAIRRARAGDVAGGLAMLETAERDTRAAAATLADPELAELADRMLELRKNLAQIAVVGGVADNGHAPPIAAAFERSASPTATPTEAATAGAGGLAPEAAKVRTGGLSPARAPDQAEQAIRQIHSQASYDLRH